jgi:hypothetical protein
MPKKSSLVMHVLSNVLDPDEPDYGTLSLAVLLVILGTLMLGYGVAFAH